jgi:hypothetical protein
MEMRRNSQGDRIKRRAIDMPSQCFVTIIVCSIRPERAYQFRDGDLEDEWLGDRFAFLGVLVG